MRSKEATNAPRHAAHDAHRRRLDARARQKARPLDGYTLKAVHDCIHSMYDAGVADVGYSDF